MLLDHIKATQLLYGQSSLTMQQFKKVLGCLCDQLINNIINFYCIIAFNLFNKRQISEQLFNFGGF